MNPGQFNKRITFMQQSYTTNDSGGTTPSLTDILTTWGSLEPFRQYNQAAIEAGANVAHGDRILKIRYRNSFQPDKTMQFRDEAAPDVYYTIASIIPYWPGTKTTFENSQETVYHDKNFVYIVGIKVDK